MRIRRYGKLEPFIRSNDNFLALMMYGCERVAVKARTDNFFRDLLRVKCCEKHLTKVEYKLFGDQFTFAVNGLRCCII